MIKRKFYLEKIVKLIDTEDIKVITGVRRCGKTVLLKQIIDELENRGIASENIIYMSFESSKYKNISCFSEWLHPFPTMVSPFGDEGVATGQRV